MLQYELRFKLILSVVIVGFLGLLLFFLEKQKSEILLSKTRNSKIRSKMSGKNTILIFFMIFWENANADFLHKGIISENRNISVLLQSENLEKINIELKYPFVAPKFETEHPESGCGKLLSRHGPEHVNETIAHLFNYGKSFFPNLNQNRYRKKRQLVAAISLTVGFLADRLIHNFFGNQHSIKSEEYLKTTIHFLLCEQFVFDSKLYDLKLEIYSEKLVRKYFQTLNTDIEKYEKGTVFGTQLQDIFENYCSEYNSETNCKKLAKISTKLVILQGYKFIRQHDFVVQLTIVIPRLIQNNAIIRKITTVPVPILNSNTYLIAQIEKGVIEFSNRSIDSSLCENHNNYFICMNIFKTTEFAQSEWKYNTVYSNEKCIITTLDSQIVISSKIDFSVQFLKLNIAIQKFVAGIHSLNRPSDCNILITCGLNSHTVFHPKNRKINLIANISEINIPLKNLKYSETEITKFEKYNGSHIIYLLIPITVLNLILIILTIVYIYKFKMTRTLTETKLLKNQSVNTSLNSLKC